MPAHVKFGAEVQHQHKQLAHIQAITLILLQHATTNQTKNMHTTNDKSTSAARGAKSTQLNNLTVQETKLKQHPRHQAF